MAVCDQRALPRSIDVTVNVSKPQAALLTDFSKLLVATTDAPYDHGLRLKAYVSIDDVLADFTSLQEPYKAARDFFAQSPRPTYLLIGKVFTTPQSGFMETRTIVPTVLPSTFAAVSDGEFTVSVDGASQDVAALDFTSVTDFDDVATILSTGVTGATVVYDANSSDNFIFTSDSTGDTSTVSSLTDTGGTGTDISGLAFLNGLDDPLTETDDLRIVAGYTPVGIVDELGLLENAGQCGGNNWYGLALTREFRDSASTLDPEFSPRLAAGWVETQRKLAGFASNDVLSLSADITSDIGSELNELGYRRSFVMYHNNADYYPEISALARLQAVDFQEREGVITLKFKDLPGIPTVNVTASDLIVLLSKRINTFTRIQTDVRTMRDGTCASSSWFIDETFNIDGLVDAIETEVYNAFLRNDRIPFNSTGRLILEDSINKACFKFTVNGTLTSRESTYTQTGDINTEPAYLIEIPLAGDLSIADRAARQWKGITVDVNLSGAVHSVTINLNAFV
jgi:hypothetical protein